MLLAIYHGDFINAVVVIVIGWWIVPVSWMGYGDPGSQESDKFNADGKPGQTDNGGRSPEAPLDLQQGTGGLHSPQTGNGGLP